MTNTFQYQKFWLRALGSLVVLPVALFIQNVVIHPLPIADIIVYAIDLCIIFAFLLIYYNITAKYNWYIRNGEYWVKDDTLFLLINSNTLQIKFNEINEIFMQKNSSAGIHAILKIKYGKKNIKLISPPISYHTKLEETQFMDIFNIIRSNAKQLQIVKDTWGTEIDYWLQKPSDKSL